MPAAHIDYPAIDNLLNELDSRAGTRRSGGDQADEDCRRERERHPFRVGCVVRFLPSGSSTAGQLRGRTRNLSRNGLGLVVRRVFAMGEPVEIEVNLAGRPRVFLAGLASFCRYAGRGYHEVGIHLYTAQPRPVFSHNPTEAMRLLDWVSNGPSAARTPAPQAASSAS